MNIVERAKEFAIKAHGKQKYGKLPYEYHLQQVVNKLMLWKDYDSFDVTDECLAVAWLHGVLEDTDTSLTDLEQHFGDEVGYQVLMLSKTVPSSYDVYIRLIKKEKVAKLVKMADTLCNLEASLLSGELKRVNKYSKQLALLTEV